MTRRTGRTQLHLHGLPDVGIRAMQESKIVYPRSIRAGPEARPDWRNLNASMRQNATVHAVIEPSRLCRAKVGDGASN